MPDSQPAIAEHHWRNTLTVRNRYGTTDKAGLTILTLWSVFWFPCCALAGYALALHPDTVFLWVWMVFGVTGVIAAICSFADLFTLHEFAESDTAYRICIRSLVRNRTRVIAKNDFLEFEQVLDEDGVRSNHFSARFTDGDKIRRLRILFWMRPACRDKIVEQLAWAPRGLPRDEHPGTAR